MKELKATLHPKHSIATIENFPGLHAELNQDQLRNMAKVLNKIADEIDSLIRDKKEKDVKKEFKY